MVYTEDDFMKDVMSEFGGKRDLRERRQKMRELVAKYGSTRKEIENNSTMADWMAYQFAGGDKVLKEVTGGF